MSSAFQRFLSVGCFVVSLFQPLCAQRIVDLGQSAKRAVSFEGPANVSCIYVLDSATRSALPGASVFLSSGSDTVRTVSDNGGVAMFRNSFQKDSVRVEVSYLGYRPLSGKVLFSSYQMILEADMVEDVASINAIIVTGESVAIVMRGDTVVYNASSFKTLRGDNLGELLKRLPGVDVSNGKIYARGEPVSKVLVNGTALFGTNIQAAMEMLYSDDVRNVKVYDRFDNERMVESDTLDAKERVVDVQTKKPISKAEEILLQMSAGSLKSSGPKNAQSLLFGFNPVFRKFEEGKPQIVASFSVEKNEDGSGNVSEEPSRGLNANFRISDSKPRKYFYDNSLTFKYDYGRNESSTSDIYGPTESYDSKMAYNSNINARSSLALSYAGMFGKPVGKESSISFKLSGSYSRLVSNVVDSSLSVIDGMSSSTSVLESTNDSDGKVSVGIEYKGRFRKRSASVSINYDAALANGGGLRLDTLSTSASPQWLVLDKGSYSHVPSVSLTFLNHFSGQWSFRAVYIGSLEISKSTRIAFDEILDRADSINTYDYTQRNLNNKINARFQYGKISDGLYAYAGLNVGDIGKIREERFPESYGTRNYNYLMLNPEAHISFKKEPFNLSLDYIEMASTPSVEELREVINDASPLFLTVGNEDLKASVDRQASFEAKYTNVVSNSTWGLNAKLIARSDGIARRTTYFSEDTDLPQYGYTALKGAQLVEPVNVDGGRTIWASLNFSTYALSSTFKSSLEYSCDRLPFYSGAEMHINYIRRSSLDLIYISGFSNYVNIFLDSRIDVGRQQRDDTKVYDFLSGFSTASVRVNFLKHFTASAEAVYKCYFPTGGYHSFSSSVLNASLEYAFGPEGKGSIAIKGLDLLDRNNPSTLSISDDFVRLKHLSTFGRGFYLEFKYRFR